MRPTRNRAKASGMLGLGKSQPDTNEVLSTHFAVVRIAIVAMFKDLTEDRQDGVLDFLRAERDGAHFSEYAKSELTEFIQLLESNK